MDDVFGFNSTLNTTLDLSVLKDVGVSSVFDDLNRKKMSF